MQVYTDAFSSTDVSPELMTLKTKRSSTGHAWDLVGITEDNKLLWREPESGYIYGPYFSRNELKKFTEESKIYGSTGRKYDYQAGALALCESRSDLGLNWTVPTGFNKKLEKKDGDQSIQKMPIEEKQLNVALDYGIQSIFEIPNEKNERSGIWGLISALRNGASTCYSSFWSKTEYSTQDGIKYVNALDTCYKRIKIEDVNFDRLGVICVSEYSTLNSDDSIQTDDEFLSFR